MVGEAKVKGGASVQHSEYSSTELGAPIEKQLSRTCSSLFNNGGVKELTSQLSMVAYASAVP